MIIFGYPGIGKTTLADGTFSYDKPIDLESSLFSTSTDPYWYKLYAKVAEDLSRQGHLVFVSTHPHVLNMLDESTEKRIIIFPSKDLKDEWIRKLDKRRNETGKFKDKRAYLHVKEHYDEDIDGLMKTSNRNEFKAYVIDSIDYDLVDILEEIKNGYDKQS